jgi:hypothetical protein
MGPNCRPPFRHPPFATPLSPLFRTTRDYCKLSVPEPPVGERAARVPSAGDQQSDTCQGGCACFCSQDGESTAVWGQG